MVVEKILLGISFAAPIGPVTAEAIRRGLLGGFSPAFRIKFGAAIGDTLFLIAAYFGVSAIIHHQFFCNSLALLGSCLLIYLGYKNIIKSFEYNYEINTDPIVFNNGMLVGFGLAITNPFAIAWWLSVFSGFLANNKEAAISIKGLYESLYIIVGVLIWDVIFCTLLEGGKRFIKPSVIKAITALAGASLCGYGCYFGISSLSKILALT